MRHGILFILSGPSGAGKTTLLEALKIDQDFVFSVSCTTRPPRPNEVDGKDYHFMTETEFLQRIENKEFLEYATVHGHSYGTLRETVMNHLSKGTDVLLDIDIQGAAMVRVHGGGQFSKFIVDVFITPPNLDELRSRLKKRATESKESLELRLRNAVNEMKCWSDYRYTILSSTREEDFRKFCSIMTSERCLSDRLNFSISPE